MQDPDLPATNNSLSTVHRPPMIELAQFVSMCSDKKSGYINIYIYYIYTFIFLESFYQCVQASLYIYIYISVMTLMFSAGISQRDSFRAL